MLSHQHHGLNSAKPQPFGGIMKVWLSTFGTVMKLETGMFKLIWKGKRQAGGVSVCKERIVGDKESKIFTVCVRQIPESPWLCLGTAFISFGFLRIRWRRLSRARRREKGVFKEDGELGVTLSPLTPRWDRRDGQKEFDPQQALILISCTHTHIHCNSIGTNAQKRCTQWPLCLLSCNNSRFILPLMLLVLPPLQLIIVTISSYMVITVVYFTSWQQLGKLYTPQCLKSEHSSKESKDFVMILLPFSFHLSSSTFRPQNPEPSFYFYFFLPTQNYARNHHVKFMACHFWLITSDITIETSPQSRRFEK